MKIKDGFVLKSIGDNHIVIPIGAQTVDFRCMITLNGTGAFLWDKLTAAQTERALVDALLAEYDVDETRAVQDVRAFMDTLRENELLEE